jgi:hypothetical protein
MKMRGFSLVSGLLSAAVIGLILVASASARRPPPPPPPPAAPPTPSTSSTYIKNFANVLNGVKHSVTPEAVETTSDGGSVALSLVDPGEYHGVSWLVKLNSAGGPQWQKEVGCFNLPDGSYAYGVSVQQTAEGGYVLGGGTIGCGSGTTCPLLGGIECALIERLDATGQLVWAKVYEAGRSRSSFRQIRQTSDGGFVAVGSTYDGSANTGALSALILKLDSQGNVQWQRTLGQAGGPKDAYLNAVQQTADGGYVTTGEFSAPSACQYGHGCGEGVLVVKLDANGNVSWQRGFNSFDGSGAPTASEHAFSIIQTLEGGYLVSGSWRNTTGPGTCCQGPLLLKLDANGTSQWQKAYSGGVYCFYNGFWYQCYAIGGLAFSVHQTLDGSYILSGAGDLKLIDSVPQVPWLAKVNASGNLLWQRFYYQSHPTTGRPLSQYFASSTLTGGGYGAVGFTENYTDLKGELFAVKTDGAGLVGACSQVHPATPLDEVDPGLATIAPALPVQATVAPQASSPATTRTTSISGTAGQC